MKLGGEVLGFRISPKKKLSAFLGVRTAGGLSINFYLNFDRAPIYRCVFFREKKRVYPSINPFEVFEHLSSSFCLTFPLGKENKIYYCTMQAWHDTTHHHNIKDINSRCSNVSKIPNRNHNIATCATLTTIVPLKTEKSYLLNSQYKSGNFGPKSDDIFSSWHFNVNKTLRDVHFFVLSFFGESIFRSTL